MKKDMYNLGLDIGTSSIKAALVNAKNNKNIFFVQEPIIEMNIKSIRNGWAEQDPNIWWKHTCNAIKRVCKESNVNPKKIISIGIAYQMHGLVLIDRNGNTLRDCIIWCDSRAVQIGSNAFKEIGPEKCLSHFLNSPGNFTASKLKWVKDNEPNIYEKTYKFMLPGDFIAFKLTGEINTTKNGLSEGIMWDFKEKSPASLIFNYFGFSPNLIPKIVDNFTLQGKISYDSSKKTGLRVGTHVTYRAGDQPNNAFSLNVFKKGQTAISGGTSGVIYSLTDFQSVKKNLKLNYFAHIDYSDKVRSIGELACINGAGAMLKWLKNLFGENSYQNMDKIAATTSIGSNKLAVFPFGNGSERILDNQNIGGQFSSINFNTHSKAQFFRATIEGIAFAFVYTMGIMKKNNYSLKNLKACNDNLFKSEIFSETIATLIGKEIEIYNTTGALGAARAANIMNDGFENTINKNSENDYVKSFHPLKNKSEYKEAYLRWENKLNKFYKS